MTAISDMMGARYRRSDSQGFIKTQHVRRFVKPLFKFNLDAPFGFGKFSTDCERIPHYKAAVVKVNNGEIVFAD